MENAEALNEQIYDLVFWTGVVRLPRYVVPLINEAFGLDISKDAKVEVAPGKLVTKLPDKALVRREMDAIVHITDQGGQRRSYHFEVESGHGGIAVRIAEYVAGAAFTSIEATENGAVMEVPHSAVIRLRGKSANPKNYIITIRCPSGELSYEVPTVQIYGRTVQALFVKELLLLVPFMGFLFGEEDFESMETGGLEPLGEAIDEVNRHLTELVGEGRIDMSQKRYILDLTGKVIDKLTVNYPRVKEGAGEMMCTYILHTETDDILEKGMKKGDLDRAKQDAMRMHEKGYALEDIAYVVDMDVSIVARWLEQEAVHA